MNNNFLNDKQQLNECSQSLPNFESEEYDNDNIKLTKSVVYNKDQFINEYGHSFVYKSIKAKN